MTMAVADGAADAAAGRAVFINRRDPPAWRTLSPGPSAQFELGLQVFNTSWVVAGTRNAPRIDGLGPQFVSDSCDSCHNNGTRGRAAAADGLPASFVMQLGGPGTERYGNVLNTAAIDGHLPEGRVRVRWSLRDHQYADGARVQLRVPRYELEELTLGPMPGRTVLRPRIAPAVFGSGLLEQVPLESLRRLRRGQAREVRGQLPSGRFGWQAEAMDLTDQTARAFAREMGLTSGVHPADDCTPAQMACREAPQGGSPEVPAELFQAVLTFQRELAVPARGTVDAASDTAGRALFTATGCAACHVPVLEARVEGQPVRIEPFTDLLLHDLGEDLADRDLLGRAVKTMWRTAPLWGMAHAHRLGGIALLHDGRARSVEEAILWHGGQATAARRAFAALPEDLRHLLLRWVESL
jgi:CxxC motif-containing protein (DUF1111 family)